MREIKFRAKSKQDYETSLDGIQKDDWVYGYYYFCRVRMCGVIKTLMAEECGGIGSGIVQVDIEVDLKTLGRFSGYWDINDHEIYEGDYLGDCGGKYVAEVRQILKGADYGAWVCTTQGQNQYLHDAVKGDEDIIVGNIYDNPEITGDSLYQ